MFRNAARYQSRPCRKVVSAPRYQGVQSRAFHSSLPYPEQDFNLEQDIHLLRKIHNHRLTVNRAFIRSQLPLLSDIDDDNPKGWEKFLVERHDTLINIHGYYQDLRWIDVDMYTKEKIVEEQIEDIAHELWRFKMNPKAIPTAPWAVIR